MTFHRFIRLLKENILWLILFPLVTAGTVFYFTRSPKKTYTSKTTIYTGFASGYSIQSVNKTGGSVDFSSIVNAFDNLLTTLNSSETTRQIALSLLAEHLYMAKPDSLVLSQPGWTKLQEAIPANYRTYLFANNDSTSLNSKLDILSRSEESNPIKTLLYPPLGFYTEKGPDAYYSIEAISSKLKANRKNTSDMLEMEYESDDRGVTQKTLGIAVQVLNKRYEMLRSDDATPVIDYFEGKSKEAKEKLKAVEAKLRAFNIEHQVLDFGEESKNIALSREGFVQEYTEELMRNKAAKAGMETLRKRMGQRGNLLTINDELIRKQTELLFAETELVSAQASGRTNDLVPELEAKVEKIKQEMQEISRRYYLAGDSPESIPQDKLIGDWLAKVIDTEESNARLEVYKNRLQEYQKKMAEYSPLGTDLHQLQRDLEVAEKEYFALAESLNEAQVHRQDVMVDNMLKIMDPPNYPLIPKPGKRLFFMALGFAVGVFIALLITAIRFLLDSRLESPENTEAKVGRPVTIIFPNVKKFSLDTKESRATVSMFEQLTNAINIDILQAPSKLPPPLITIFSIRSKQGKTWISHGLARLYAETGQEIAYFYPRNTKLEVPFEQNGVSFYPYTIRQNFMNVSDLTGLLGDNKAFATSPYHKIILELPPLISSPLPVYLLNKSLVTLFVVDANSIWGRKEKQLMDLFNKISTTDPIVILNRVEKEYIDAPTPKEAEQIVIKPELLLKHQRKLPSSSNA
ncbi:GumC family protein [Runella sp.]|uniref:GumC family protein n=1 Tax=Runella sp. TaxID=1960881 RepID=UPI003D0D553B